MKTQNIALSKKLFLQKQTVAVMNGNTDMAKGLIPHSAPFETAFSTNSPLRCFPCCMAEITQIGCRN